LGAPSRNDDDREGVCSNLEEISNCLRPPSKKRRREATEKILPVGTGAHHAADTAVKEAQASGAEQVSDAKTDRVRGNTTTDKVVKADGAQIPFFLWNEAVVRGLPWLVAEDSVVHGALEVLRARLFSPYWRRKVGRDFLKWFKGEAPRMELGERLKTINAGGEALRYTAKASWWKWDGGNFPFFWRWPVEFQREIHDGVRQRFIYDPPECQVKQRVNSDANLRTKERKKIEKAGPSPLVTLCSSAGAC
jgi:hypothetical protein